MAGRLELLVDEQSIWIRHEVRRSERWAAWATALAVFGSVLFAACSAAAGPRAAGRLVYVADTKRDEISQFRASRSPHGALKPLARSTVRAGPFPYTIAVDPQGTSAYATSSASKVYQYTINPTTGRLTPKSPATVATKSGGTAAIAFSPNGTSAYIVGKNISQYSIDATTGDLTPKSPATVATPPNPEPIAVSANGKYAYVANCGGCGYALQKTPSHAAAGAAAVKRHHAKPSYLVEYRIKPRTGALSPKPIAKMTTGNGANWIAIAPNGKSVYVATSTHGVWQYTINPTTGRLSPKNPETTGGTEHNIVIAPNGKNAYVIGATRRGVSQYRINPRTGTLSPKPMSTADTVLHPEALALSADGKNAYATSENDPEIAQYTINPTTGKITAMTPATVKTASGALGLAVTPIPSAK
jgi:6-phosphogluconolactonase (cycloisomerase 2 family)